LRFEQRPISVREHFFAKRWDDKEEENNKGSDRYDGYWNSNGHDEERLILTYSRRKKRR